MPAAPTPADCKPRSLAILVGGSAGPRVHIWVPETRWHTHRQGHRYCSRTAIFAGVRGTVVKVEAAIAAGVARNTGTGERVDTVRTGAPVLAWFRTIVNVEVAVGAGVARRTGAQERIDTVCACALVLARDAAVDVNAAVGAEAARSASAGERVDAVRAHAAVPSVSV